MKLIDVAKTAWEEAKRMQKAGEVPTFMGVEGMLALMYNNLVRNGKNADNAEVLTMAANAILCLDIAISEEEKHGMTSQIDEAVVDYSEEVTYTKTDPNDVPPPPAEFDNWQTIPNRAAGLYNWLMDKGHWDNITAKQRAGLLEAMEGADNAEETEYDDEIESLEN